MSRNSMETCNEDLYLLVFRAISREKTRKGIEGGLERPRSGRRGKEAFLGRLDEEKRTERDRGEEVEKAVEPCWKLLKSARARDGSGSEGRNERKGGRTERIV